MVWHTDIRNDRSQAAIARLGATREGVLRHHRIRPDGSWRDTVQYAMLAEDWPAASTCALRARLRDPWSTDALAADRRRRERRSAGGSDGRAPPRIRDKPRS